MVTNKEMLKGLAKKVTHSQRAQVVLQPSMVNRGKWMNMTILRTKRPSWNGSHFPTNDCWRNMISLLLLKNASMNWTHQFDGNSLTYYGTSGWETPRLAAKHLDLQRHQIGHFIGTLEKYNPIVFALKKHMVLGRYWKDQGSNSFLSPHFESLFSHQFSRLGRTFDQRFEAKQLFHQILGEKLPIT